MLEESRILALRLGKIEVDGLDAQTVALSLLKGLAYDVLMLSGVSFAGFNVVDIKSVARAIGKPVIAVIREKPNNRDVRSALQNHFDDWGKRWRAVRNAGRIYSCRPVADEPKLYFEVRGGSPSVARQAIFSSSTISRLPEPIRVAGILAKGLRVPASNFHEVD